MRIGFDAKRAFLNKSGLGNYSRNLIHALSTNYPETNFFLYTTKTNPELFDPSCSNIQTCIPLSFIHRKMSSFWRSYGLSGRVGKDRIDLFHGLSHEIPYGFPVGKVKSVVTIHDLIFLRMPQLYSAVDRFIYTKKFSYACRTADRIIAISKQTAADITELLPVSPDKIDVIHQGCNPAFYKTLSNEEKEKIRTSFNLPRSFLLYVGTIEERKNLLSLLRAMNRGNIDIPLVVIGKQTAYAQKIQRFIEQHETVKTIFFDVVKNTDLLGFYQLADAFIYPSVYEGFGIPILESLASKTPVITSRDGCFAEAGGPASIYIDPANSEEFATSIKKVLEDSKLRDRMISEGYQHALGFNANAVAANVMDVYKKVLNHD